jgi:hypothetical protein
MCRIKIMLKGRGRRFIMQHAAGRGRVSTCPLFSHLSGAEMSFRFK